jgi:hypothetical protein
MKHILLFENFENTGGENIILYHGTTSKNADEIKKNGFDKISYFTTSKEDAEFYAVTGGETDLQEREERFEEEHGYSIRDEYEPDLYDMYKYLYPSGQYPVIITVSLPYNIYIQGHEDSGADGGVVFDDKISTEYIINIEEVEW